MKYKFLFFSIAAFCFTTSSFAQITPPGMGHTQTASWLAFGVKQKLDDKNSLNAYIGAGRISTPGSLNPFKKHSALVINAEIGHKFSKGWKYGYSLSYRQQNKYDDRELYPASHPSFIREARLYGKLSHTLEGTVFKYAFTLRQEARAFFTPDFHAAGEDAQLRTRIKAAATIPLRDDNSDKLTGTAESLFTLGHEQQAGWDNYKYSESRFSLYYSHNLKNLPVIIDAGYINILKGHGNDTSDSSYIAMDIIVKDIF
ncbi:DUF2490 domain-containing protein [Flavobacterium sp. MK4S-17]|uniref:DUF2490 domain-containing protein n=1 Tax=Flavobacterium sp. MK4S-17 TaxID=2543737 RepID=UPI0013572F5C|nr:DUF2490 domain-containing protein [Flavobacterium sp. MK4S-17]